MIREGIETLYEFGYPACVVLGDPNYYHRFGFEASEKHHMRCAWDVSEGMFQVLAMAEGELNGRSGLIEYSEEFAQF